jgi:phosphoribosylaminoimidazole carboxylase PurE protein
MPKLKTTVLIIVGSPSDLPTMEKCTKVLEDFEVPFEITVASAHRSPERAMELATNASKRGVKVIIAGAGLAAHLAGVLAAHTNLPVIGVPMAAGPFKGFDSLLSTVQMPPGVPVATVAVGDAGAANSAHLAVRILALADTDLKKKLNRHIKSMAKKVEQAAKKIEKN